MIRSFFDINKESIFNLMQCQLKQTICICCITSLISQIVSADFNQKKYEVNNNTYTVAITNDLDHSIKDLGFEVVNKSMR
jgi:hypothetical protein